MVMKKSVLLLFVGILLLSLMGVVEAKENNDTVKDLAIASLSDYGRQVFNRGDYPQAATVYARILAYDPNNVQAQQYLRAIKAKGYPVAESLLMPIKRVETRKVVEAVKIAKQEVKADIAAKQAERRKVVKKEMAQRGVVKQGITKHSAPVQETVVNRAVRTITPNNEIVKSTAELKSRLAVETKTFINEEMVMPVVQDNLDQDLANLQKDLGDLRKTLNAKQQQIQTLEKKLIPAL